MSRAIRFFTPFLLLSLAGCATAIGGSQQQVAFETIGAVDAKCDVFLGDEAMAYTVRPPQKIWIMKSAKDMTINCNAAGGRFVTQKVEASVAPTTFLNAFNGILPGAAYDGTSGAMFNYPDTITIDFSHTIASAQPMPSYHNLDTLDPDRAATIEDMGPDVPKAAGDDALDLRHKMAQLQADAEAAQAAKMEAEKQKRIGDFYNVNK